MNKSKRISTVFFIAVFAFLSVGSNAYASTLLFDDFNDGYSGWSTSGDVTSDTSPAIGANSVRLRGNGIIWRTVSTQGSTGISVSWTMAAGSLEGSDKCQVEYNTGSGWNIIATLVNGQDNQSFYSGTVNLGTDADNNANFQIRYRVIGASADYCYAEDTTISDGGSGGGSRTVLTYDYLMNGPESGSPINDGAVVAPRVLQQQATFLKEDCLFPERPPVVDLLNYGMTFSIPGFQMILVSTFPSLIMNLYRITMTTLFP